MLHRPGRPPVLPSPLLPLCSPSARESLPAPLHGSFLPRPLGALCSAAALGGPQPGGLSWPPCSPRTVAPVAPARYQACGSPPSPDHPVQSLLPLPLEGLLPQAGCSHPATACRCPSWLPWRMASSLSREARRAVPVCRAPWLSGCPSCVTGVVSESENPHRTEVGPDVVAVRARSGESAPTACLWSPAGTCSQPRQCLCLSPRTGRRKL